jgi:hypothetical protein
LTSPVTCALPALSTWRQRTRRPQAVNRNQHRARVCVRTTTWHKRGRGAKRDNADASYTKQCGRPGAEQQDVGSTVRSCGEVGSIHGARECRRSCGYQQRCQRLGRGRGGDTPSRNLVAHWHMVENLLTLERFAGRRQQHAAQGIREDTRWQHGVRTPTAPVTVKSPPRVSPPAPTATPFAVTSPSCATYKSGTMTQGGVPSTPAANN